MTHETEFGTQPFEKIVIEEFELRGLNSMKHAAELQYKLMLLEPVLRVQVNYPKRSMIVYYIDPKKNTELILNTISPVKATLKSKKTVDYDLIVAKSYHR